LIALRPNNGIDARDYQKVIGEKIKYDVSKHQKLEWKMFE
jgi:sialic acid synthase SpsE